MKNDFKIQLRDNNKHQTPSLFLNLDREQIIKKLVQNYDDEAFYCSNVSFAYGRVEPSQSFGYVYQRENTKYFLELSRNNANSCTKILDKFPRFFIELQACFKNNKLGDVVRNCQHLCSSAKIESGPLVKPLNLQSVVVVCCERNLGTTLENVLKAQLMRNHGLVIITSKDTDTCKDKLKDFRNIAIINEQELSMACGMYNGLKEQIVNLEQNKKNDDERFQNLSSRFQRLDNDFNRVKRENQDVKGMIAEVLGQFDKLVLKYEEALNQLTKTEQYLDSLDKYQDINKVDQQLEELKDQIKTLLSDYNR